MLTSPKSTHELVLDLDQQADAQAFLELAQRDWPSESARRVELWRNEAQARVQSAQSMQLLKSLIAEGRIAKLQ